MDYFEELKQAVRDGQGTNFTLAMRDDETGEISLHRRYNQPCQGGEMRKYKTTHPDDCTRPDDRRPTDLRHPFPKGTPEAVGVRFQNFGQWGIIPQFVDDLLDHGPYHEVSGDHHYVLDKNSDLVVGIIFENMDVDSTAFVNMLQFVKSSSYTVWSDLLELGFSSDEIANVMYLTSPGQSIRRTIIQPYSYYFSTVVNMKRLLAGEFNDLTGGTFRDRFDYNRPEIQDLFKVREGEHGTNFMKLLSSRHKWKMATTDSNSVLKWGCQDDLADIIRSIINEELEKCEEVKK